MSNPARNWPHGASAHGPRTKKKMRRLQQKKAQQKLEDQRGMFAGYGVRATQPRDRG